MILQLPREINNGSRDNLAQADPRLSYRTQKLKTYLCERGVVVGEDSAVVFQPTVTHERSPLLFVLFLPFVTDVP